jgi:hypothetical protein
MKYTAIAYNFPSIKNIDSFTLFIQIDYIIIPFNLILLDNILYEQFIELKNKKELKIYSYEGDLGIKGNGINDPCKYFLQAQ